VCHADGCTYNVILYTAADALLSRDGDSGAPIYYFRSDGRLQIVGMHIGRDGSNMYAEKWGSIQVGLGATILTCC
jgi:hypothetical protein